MAAAALAASSVPLKQPCYVHFLSADPKKSDCSYGAACRYSHGPLVEAQKTRPCKEWFSQERNGTCSRAERCPFSHVDAVYMQSRQLKYCPTSGCVNMCKQTSMRCMACHEAKLAQSAGVCYAYERTGKCTREGCRFLHRPIGQIPCPNYFGSSGEECPPDCLFGHTDAHETEYLESHDLKRCPADGCPNYCGANSNLCRECFHAHRHSTERPARTAAAAAELSASAAASSRKRGKKQAEPDGPRKCRGSNCKAVPRPGHALCDACAEVERTYTVHNGFNSASGRTICRFAY